MNVYIAHTIIGAVGALCGIYARGFCRHRVHQIVVGATLIVIEAIVSVQLVG